MNQYCDAPVSTKLQETLPWWHSSRTMQTASSEANKPPRCCRIGIYPLKGGMSRLIILIVAIVDYYSLTFWLSCLWCRGTTGELMSLLCRFCLFLTQALCAKGRKVLTIPGWLKDESSWCSCEEVAMVGDSSSLEIITSSTTPGSPWAPHGLHKNLNITTYHKSYVTQFCRRLLCSGTS